MTNNMLQYLPNLILPMLNIRGLHPLSNQHRFPIISQYLGQTTEHA